MAYIKEEIINEIRSKADIVDIISGYLSGVSAKGKNFTTKCPFHQDRSPSLIISPEKQIFNCFVCHEGGNVFSFIMKYENVSFVEALKIVADKIGFKLDIGNNEHVVKNKEELEIYEFATKYYMNNMNSLDGVKAREYLSKRGINDEIVKEFRIGYSGSEKDSFFKIASSKGWDVNTLDKLGLINKVNENIYDTFINRIVIPIENLQGDVVGFTGRIFNGEDNTAKYLNTKETDIFKKGSLLFNYHNAKNHIRERKSVIVVEGNMDAIKMSAKGFKNTIALQGVALLKEQVEYLKRLKVPVILMLDNDNAGLEATIKNGNILINNEIETKVVRLSGAKDPDEYLEKFGIEAMQNNINQALKYIDFKIEILKKDKNLDNIEDLITYVKEVIESLNGQDDLTKEVILSKISKDYQVDIDILRKNLGEEKKKVFEKKEEKKTKMTKYEKASHRVLYYMLMDTKYINIYKNSLGYLKERMERVLASEINYYARKWNTFDVADFTSAIMEKEDEYRFLQIILSENGNTSINDDEFDACIKAIKKVYQNEEIAKVKAEIASEFDQAKKEVLLEKLIELKRKCE